MSPYCLPDALLEAMLQEDVPYGDLTSRELGLGGQTGRISFSARDEMVLCGSEEARRLGALRGLQALPDSPPSGTRLAPGAAILTLQGDVAALHTVWKTAQTLMECLSGIASSAALMVANARLVAPEVVVACTRKHFPAGRAASIKAIVAGGATPHRLGLSDSLLVFPEHRQFMADEPPAHTVMRLRRQCPEKKIVVEVCSVEEALRWMAAGADVLQLEKLPPHAVAQVVAATSGLDRPPTIAAAGGINPANAGDYAGAGAGLLVTSFPYMAAPRDVQVRFC